MVLEGLVDDDWCRIIQHSICAANTVTELPALLDAMQKYLRDQRSVLLDRREFFSRRQAVGESFDEFLISLKEISKFCDFCPECSDERLRDQIVMGVRDESLLRSLLNVKDLKLQEALGMARSHEVASKNCATLTHHTVQRVGRKSQYQRQGHKACKVAIQVALSFKHVQILWQQVAWQVAGLWQDDSPPTRVFESVSADYFHYGGRTSLVYADRLSGWPYVTSCPRSASAAHLVTELRALFAATGVPALLRSEGM